MRDEAAPPLEVDELEVSVGGRFRLGPVSLTVRGGERVALIGPSGAGKTTLLRQIAGTGPEPGSGVVRIDGREIRTLHRRERAAAVGLLHQSHDLVDPLRARHNVQAGLLGRWSSARAAWALLGWTKAPVADEALARVGLADRAEDRTAHLSGGERQRIAIARLLVQAPRLMLADEPVASLDPALAAEILELLTDLASDGRRALVCSLHQPDLASRYFDRIVGVRAGRVLFQLPSADVDAAHLDGLYGGSAP